MAWYCFLNGIASLKVVMYLASLNCGLLWISEWLRYTPLEKARVGKHKSRVVNYIIEGILPGERVENCYITVEGILWPYWEEPHQYRRIIQSHQEVAQQAR